MCGLAGCAQLSGLDELGVCDGACEDATTDAALDAPTFDATAVDAFVLDAPMNESGKDTQAKDAGGDVIAIPDAQDDISCTRPGDCIPQSSPDAAFPPDAGKVCCATIVETGNFPCTYVSQTTKCEDPTSCPTSIAFNCGTTQLRRCAFGAECVEPSYDKCCTLKTGPDASAMFCANNSIASIVGGSCP
jgi:hypothetical protein